MSAQSQIGEGHPAGWNDASERDFCEGGELVRVRQARAITTKFSVWSADHQQERRVASRVTPKAYRVVKHSGAQKASELREKHFLRQATNSIGRVNPFYG
jgi:hypothetical protein